MQQRQWRGGARTARHGHVHHAWRRFHRRDLARLVRELIAAARARDVLAVRQHLLAGPQRDRFAGPEHGIADSVGNMRKAGLAQTFDSGSLDREIRIVRRHDRVARHGVLQLLNARRAAVDNRIGINRPLQFARSDSRLDADSCRRQRC
jgi:hypothetical protein